MKNSKMKNLSGLRPRIPAGCRIHGKTRRNQKKTRKNQKTEPRGKTRDPSRPWKFEV